MKLKKAFFIVPLILLLGGITSCARNLRNLNDGTFIGSGVGRNGNIEVEITVTNGKIVAAKILNDKETPEIAEEAKNEILQKFLTDGTTSQLDTLSGATITTNGLLDALDAAVAAAQGLEASDVSYHDTECDIVIIGAGGAGLVAATEAASKGAGVIVLEKQGTTGGNSNNSTGGINASYTKEQERLGIRDSKDVFFNDTMRGGQYLNNTALVHKLVDESARMVEWLQSPMIGADLSDVGMFGGATNKRIHRPKGGGAIGAHLIPLLHKAAIKQGAEIRFYNRAVDIISKGGKAAGVKVRYKDKEYKIMAKTVIITTGGFGANPKLIEFYQPALAGFATTNNPGSTGDAFAMVEKFDAALVHMEQIQIHPTVVKGSGFMISEAVRGNGAILVYKNGTRFINEIETRNIVSGAVLRGKEKSAFLIFDQGIRDSLKVIDSYAKFSWMIEAPSIKELAEKAKIDPQALEQTVQNYNQSVELRRDDEFGRNPSSMERKIENAPFYAIEIEPAIHHTMGGLKINTEAQVINKAGNPIPGLYAAGEVTGGIHGAERLGGNAVADFCIFGKIAADSAVNYIRFK